MRTLLPAGLLLLVGAISAAPASDGVLQLPASVPSAVEKLAVVNYANGDPLTVTTHIENAFGDKLDFNGDHFFGRDPEKHDFNRQAHVKLEQARNQDPHLRRFLAKSIVKREGPYPPAVYPPTHYEPPTTTTTTTTTTEAPTTTTTEVLPTPSTGVPHEVYGLPPGEPEPVLCVPKSWDEHSDCVLTEYSPLVPVVPPLEVPPVCPPEVLCNGGDASVPVPNEPSVMSLYNLNAVVGNVYVGYPLEAAYPEEDPQSNVGASGCTNCDFSQLPALPELVYPTVTPGPPTTTAPEPTVPNCLPVEFLKTHPGKLPLFAEKTVPKEDGVIDGGVVDLRLVDGRKETPDVLTTQSQVILVQGMDPYPVLKAKTVRTAPNRQTQLLQRGSIRFVQSLRKTNDVQRPESGQQWRQNEVTVSEEQPVEEAQFVLCTVNCYSVEEKFGAPETPHMEIPSDGRLWK